MKISKKLMMPVLALTVSAALFSSTIVNAGATAVAKTDAATKAEKKPVQILFTK